MNFVEAEVHVDEEDDEDGACNNPILPPSDVSGEAAVSDIGSNSKLVDLDLDLGCFRAVEEADMYAKGAVEVTVQENELDGVVVHTVVGESSRQDKNKSKKPMVQFGVTILRRSARSLEVEHPLEDCVVIPAIFRYLIS